MRSIATHPHLGALAGSLLADALAVHTFYDDPITQACGCADELAPLVARQAAERSRRTLALWDTTAAAASRAIADRTSLRWLHSTPLGDWLWGLAEVDARDLQLRRLGRRGR